MGEIQAAADERPYWETMDYAGSNIIVKANLKNGCQAVIAMGYYLKHIRENRLYRDGGYKSFGEYVKTECGLTETAASRSISQMEKFSEEGNSPKLAKKWEEFGTSKLQEILYLTDEQAESVTPDMTVKEIREIRKPETLPEPEGVIVTTVELPPATEEAPLVVEGNIEDLLPDASEPAGSEEAGPARCVTGQSESGFCGAAAYCNKPVSCCVNCSEDCNGRCGWLTKKVAGKQEEFLATSQETEEDETEERLEIPLYELGLKLRTYETLRLAGIDTIEKLQGLNSEDLSRIRKIALEQIDDIKNLFEAWERETASEYEEEDVFDLSENGSEPAESESNLPKPEQEGEELDHTVPVYDKWLLREMIEEAEGFVNGMNMDEDWKRSAPRWFTRQAMNLEAYHLLLDKYEGKEEEEE